MTLHVGEATTIASVPVHPGRARQRYMSVDTT